MDWRLFISTFALIFIAEIGDKTQLATLAVSAGAKSPLSVFAGAAVALVLGSLIAVLIGVELHRLVPERYIRLAAAIMFILVGVLLLVNVWRSAPGEARAATQPRGLVARIVLDIAADFEKATALDYEKLAQSTKTESLRVLLRALADEERRHVAQIQSAIGRHGQAAWGRGPAERLETMLPDANTVDTDIARALAAAARHEEATARFYRQLAASTRIAPLRAVFTSLAAQETEHARRLAAYKA